MIVESCEETFVRQPQVVFILAIIGACIAACMKAKMKVSSALNLKHCVIDNAHVSERPQLAGYPVAAVQPYPGHEAGVLAEVQLHDARSCGGTSSGTNPAKRLSKIRQR